MDINGKNIIITGGAGGLGRAMAIELARQGANLLIVDINLKCLRETKRTIERAGGRCLILRIDVSKKEQVRRMIQTAVASFQHIDILINNAGVTILAEAVNHEIGDWEWITGINYWGPIYAIHYILPHMIKRRAGHIVNIASMGGLVSVPGNISYNATKFALVGLSETLRSELGRYNIGVTLICPGFLSSNMSFEKSARVKSFSRYKTGDLATGKVLPVEQAASRFVRAIKNERFMVKTGAQARIYHAIKFIAPFLYRMIGDKLAADLEKWR